MKILNLQQGTDAWRAHRAQHWNASDAPAMLGCSPYKTRSQLIRECATGISLEHDAATEARFADGHRFEALARPLAEAIIGAELFPCVGVEGRYSASFDGLTMAGEDAFEHKSLNDDLRACMRDEGNGWDLPKHYQVQMEQQLLVSGAERVLFMASKWKGDELVEERHCWYASDPKLRAEIVAGWQQFDADVAAYEPEPVRAAPVAAPVEGFGALSLRVEGRIIASNLDAFKAGAEQFIARLPKPEDLQTDQDFADAKGAVKACEEAEARIKAAKDAAQAEMTDVDAAFRLADSVAQTIRAARLALDKVVKVEEQARKDAIVRAGADAVRAHYDQINATMGEHRILPPGQLVQDLCAAIKGKKSLASMKDAVDTAVAGFKIAASEQAERVRANVRVLEMEQGSHGVLFPDRVVLCLTKTPEDLRNLITARIAQAKADQEKRDEEKRQREADEAALQESRGNDASAAAEPTTTAPTRAPAPVTRVGAGAAPVPAGARIKLGDINARIAPITVTADGLASLGFRPLAKEKGAVLYAMADFGLICAALQDVLADAAQQKEA